jgi:hypothetical protein
VVLKGTLHRSHAVSLPPSPTLSLSLSHFTMCGPSSVHVYSIIINSPSIPPLPPTLLTLLVSTLFSSCTLYHYPLPFFTTPTPTLSHFTCVDPLQFMYTLSSSNPLLYHSHPLLRHRTLRYRLFSRV